MDLPKQAIDSIVKLSAKERLDYYKPDAGRFVNQDPIRLSGGDNLYLQ